MSYGKGWRNMSLRYSTGKYNPGEKNIIKCLACNRKYDQNSFRICPHCRVGEKQMYERLEQMHTYFKYRNAGR